ncbi:MAG: hypothetical protein WC889_02775 [Myxococcota bacterium]
MFPTAFYGKGGAPASGALSFADFYGLSASFTVSAPSPVTGVGSGAVVITTTISATPTGGTAPFAYAWTKTMGDAISITSPSTQSTAFLGGGMLVGEIRGATFRCTVTDANMVVALSDLVTVTVERT